MSQERLWAWCVKHVFHVNSTFAIGHNSKKAYFYEAITLTDGNIVFGWSTKEKCTFADTQSICVKWSNFTDKLKLNSNEIGHVMGCLINVD